jgi:outer membrane protein insertion porin family
VKSLLVRWALALTLGVCALPLLQAQDTAYFGKRVSQVLYVPAKQPADPIDLKRVQRVKAGAILRSEDVATTIDEMFATGYYQDIQVDAENAGDGVVVRFLTTATSFVGHQRVAGKIKTPPSEGQLLSAMHFTPGTPFQPEMLKAAEANITQLLKSNGFYLSQVTVNSRLNQDTEEMNVTVHVDPGKRAKYEKPIIHGDLKLSEAAIVRATGWKIRFINYWRRVTAELTNSGLSGIHKKYQSQDRLTATVNLDSLEYDPEANRVQPTLTIEGGPKVEIKALEAKVSKRRLKRYVPVYQEGSVDRDLLTEGARNLRDYFQASGYPDVDVTFREHPPENDKELIEYYIAKGQKKKLVKLNIEGNKYFQRDTLAERMFLKPSSIQFLHGRYSEAFRKKDEEAIENLYKANGFRDVKVTSFLTNNYRSKPHEFAATFHVEEGQQWTVANLKVTGVNRLDPALVQGALSMSAGQPYSDVNVASDRNTILTLYSGKGFPKATFEYAATPTSKPRSIDLTYRIVEGPQEFVRGVLLLGLHRTKRSLVESRITVQPGDPLSLVDISEVQRSLYNLGIFSTIDAGVQNPDGDATRKYVFYDFDEAKRYNVNVGFGAGFARFGPVNTNLRNPAGSNSFSPRVSLDVSRLNFLGTASTITVQTRFSNIEQRAAVNYLIPTLLGHEGRDLTLTGLFDSARDVQTFASKRQEVSAQVSQHLSKPTTLSLRMAYRRVTTSDVVIPSLLISQLLQPVRIGIVSANIVEDRRDDPADAHRGIYNTLDVGVATKYLGSQRNFLRALGRNATYTRIGKNLVFARQLTFGIIFPYGYPAGLGQIESVPLPERFFGGGSISDRAFGENQAGPRDIGVVGANGIRNQATGFPVGGNAVLFSNLELRFPLLGENIGGVLFEDAGNVYQTLGDVSFRYGQKNNQDFNYMVHAAGFGIRYKTPIGPVRVDLGYTLNPPHFIGFKGSYQDLLNCGPTGSQATGSEPSKCQSVEQSTGHFQFFFSIGQTF